MTMLIMTMVVTTTMMIMMVIIIIISIKHAENKSMSKYPTSVKR